MARKRKKRSTTRRSSKSESLAAQAYAQESDEFTFEEDPSMSIVRIQDAIILLYGPPKIGKTKLLSLFKGVYFLPTEPGYKAINVRKTYLPNWVTFTNFVKKMEKRVTLRKQVTIYCIDTADNLGKFCMQYTCGREGIAHPTDHEWGKGWEAFRDEFAHWILRLSALGAGVAFISHLKHKEVVVNHVKIPKEVPDLPKTCYTIINNLVDITLYMGVQSRLGKAQRRKLRKRGKYVPGKRFLLSVAEDARDAGDRLGRIPHQIVFDKEQEAVDILVSSFDDEKPRKKIKKKAKKKIKKKVRKKVRRK